MAQSPCFLLSPCWFPFPSLLFPFTYLEPLLGVIGSRPPRSQVTRKLTSPFLTPPHSLPIPNSQYPQVNYAPYYDDIMIPASLGLEHKYHIMMNLIILFRHVITQNRKKNLTKKWLKKNFSKFLQIFYIWFYLILGLNSHLQLFFQLSSCTSWSFKKLGIFHIFNKRFFAYFVPFHFSWNVFVDSLTESTLLTPPKKWQS